MKRLISILSVISMGILLTACGSGNRYTKSNSTLKAENSSLKANMNSTSSTNVSKYKNDEYALAAYLKLQNQSANDLEQSSDNMNWKQQDENQYSIDFGAHTTQMTVNKDNVEVTYDDVEGDHMGQGNGHKTYTKQQLNKIIKNQRKVIDSLLSTHESNDKTSNDNQDTQTKSSSVSNSNKQNSVSNNSEDHSDHHSDNNDNDNDNNDDNDDNDDTNDDDNETTDDDTNSTPTPATSSSVSPQGGNTTAQTHTGGNQIN